MDKEVIYEIPKWGMYLLASVVMVMAFGFFYTGMNLEKWFSDAPTELKYLFYAVSFVSLIAVYRLSSWKRFIFFKVNCSGMLFPCPKLKKCDSEYLFVPWKHIRNIKMDVFTSASPGNAKGVSIDLRISLDDRNQYFPELLLREYAEWTTVGFTDAFLNKKKAICQLNQIKSQCT